MRLVDCAARRWRAEDVRAVPRKVSDVRVTELAEGIICLRLPLPYPAPAPASVNCYILAGGDGHTIVDAGTSLDPGWQALERALSKASLEPRAIRTLVITHMHSDHAGGAAVLVEHSGCEVVRLPGPDTANDAFRDVRAPREDRHAACLREGVPPDELRWWADTNLADDGHHPHLEPDRLLADADLVETAVGNWRVVPTPGHSPTQIALFEERSRWVVSADLAYGRGTPFLEFGHSPDPVADHLGSLDRVERLSPERLLPGHGPPAETPLRVLARARNATLAACARVRAELPREPRSAYEIALPRLREEPNANRRQEILALTASVLAHFERRGDLEAEIGEDGVRRVRRAARGDP
jgi:glyoxylase-like metal-dependent hydrolase (beta-lactamase superfamily II)